MTSTLLYLRRTWQREIESLTQSHTSKEASNPDPGNLTQKPVQSFIILFCNPTHKSEKVLFLEIRPYNHPNLC